ncbi:cellulose biosynthesis cyclic di-GMP-binding regulatory protein BcsB [Paraburkholderia sediminicola]|uniref:cellulose synthase n=1 Tax=Paraburkholderia sediminicola TaxID=458836 RepID=UPI0038B90E14
MITAITLFATSVAPAVAADLADAFAQLGGGRSESRTVSLADLGIREPVVLRAPDTIHELYLPVPAGLPIRGATLQMDGNYLRSDGGRTTLLLSLDGSPVLARNVNEAQGDGSISIGVDGSPRPSGFVRVGMQWSSVINDSFCTDQTAIGNLWRVAPTSRLTYQFDTAAINDVRTAWSALPPSPVVLVGGKRLSAAGYDAAWRIEALLMRGGANPVTRLLPSVGDTVDLANVSVPAALQPVPAFAALAALAAGGQHKIANPAELGALLALAPASAFAPNVVVADDALRASVSAALDALRAQVVGVSPDAASAFDSWRNGAAGALGAPLAAGEVKLARLNGLPAVVVGDSTGVAALSRAWTPIDVSNRLVVHELSRAPNISAGGDSDKLALSLVGGEPRTLDVLTSASWEANFDLAAVSGHDKVPRKVVLDLVAAPASNRNAQTASVFFNGVLIGSQLLDTNGRAQRVEADIPVYALGATNQLRVLFQRQPEGGCQPRAQGYPAAVLPGSYLQLGTAPLDDDFTGMVVRFSTGTNLLVPDAYLDDPLASLPRVARIANAASIAPTHAILTVLPNGQSAKPDNAFLALDVALDKENAHARFAGDRLTLTGRSGNVLADMSGLNGLGVIEVIRASGTPGVVYRTLGTTAPVLPATLAPLRGDVALVDASGVLKQFDTQHAGAVPPTDNPRGWIAGHWAAWGVPTVVIILLLLLLWAAHVGRRRAAARAAAATARPADVIQPDNPPTKQG